MSTCETEKEACQHVRQRGVVPYGGRLTVKG